MFSDEELLGMLKAVGAEEFDTGNPERLWALHEGTYNAPELSGIPIDGEIRTLTCRISDRKTHELVRDGKLTRVLTGEEVFVKRFEPNRSTGLLTIRLKK